MAYFPFQYGKTYNDVVYEAARAIADNIIVPDVQPYLPLATMLEYRMTTNGEFVYSDIPNIVYKSDWDELQYVYNKRNSKPISTISPSGKLIVAVLSGIFIIPSFDLIHTPDFVLDKRNKLFYFVAVGCRSRRINEHVFVIYSLPKDSLLSILPIYKKVRDVIVEIVE